MALLNAQKQDRYRKRSAHMANVEPRQILMRYLAAAGTAVSRGMFASQADQVVEEFWPYCHEVGQFRKAASSPATMATAVDLVANAVVDFVLNNPASCGSALLSRGQQYRFDRHGGLLVPGMAASASDAAFIGETTPISVHQGALGGVTIVPSKLKTIYVANSELFEHSTPNIEQTITNAVNRIFALKMDSVMFGSTAATSTAPVGLLYGVTPLAHEATLTGSEAAKKEVENVAGAVSSVAGNSEIVLIASPKQAIALRMLPNLPFEVLSTSALAAGTLVAVATNALISAVDPSPVIEISNTATLNFDDSSPQDISTSGVLAQGSTRSLWQTDAVGIKMEITLGYGLACDGAVAYTNSVAW
jgi:hypothetical protein